MTPAETTTTVTTRRSRSSRPHTTTTTSRPSAPAHHGRDPFASATQGPMRRDYALNRFLRLTAGFRRG